MAAIENDKNDKRDDESPSKSVSKDGKTALKPKESKPPSSRSHQNKSVDGKGGKATQGTSRSRTSTPSTPSTTETAVTDPAVVMGLVLEELKSLKKTTGDISEQLNSQAAHIAFLDDEMKIQGNRVVNEEVDEFNEDDFSVGKKPSDSFKVPSKSEIVRAIAPMDDGDVSGEEDEEKEELDENEEFEDMVYGRVKKGRVPTPEQIEAFKRGVKLDETSMDDEWCTQVKAKASVDFWTSKSECRDFRGPERDVDVPDLRYKNRKDTERDLSQVHRVTGALSFASISVLDELKEVCGSALQTMAEFADPQIEIADPRREAAVSLENVKTELTTVMKSVTSISRMSQYAFCRVLRMRRAQYIDSVDRGAAAKEMVKRLKPTTQLLFGNKLREVCRTLKDGGQLTSQLQSRGPKAPAGQQGHGSGQTYRKYGSFRGKGPFRGRGGLRGGKFRGGNKDE